MPVQIIRAARALTPTEEIIDAAVVIEDGIITAVGRREEIIAPKGAKDHDARIHILVPGFVDVHIHGAGPDKWRDYSALSITRASYAQDVQAARQFAFRRGINRIGKPDDPQEWGGFTPATVNASYSPSRNDITGRYYGYCSDGRDLHQPGRDCPLYPESC